MFLRIGVLEICRKFTREHPCRSVISIKLQSNIIEITLPHGCSPVNLLHIFRTPFPRNTSGWLLLIRRTTLYLSQIHKNCKSQWQNDLISVKVDFNCHNKSSYKSYRIFLNFLVSTLSENRKDLQVWDHPFKVSRRVCIWR